MPSDAPLRWTGVGPSTRLQRPQLAHLAVAASPADVPPRSDLLCPASSQNWIEYNLTYSTRYHFWRVLPTNYFIHVISYQLKTWQLTTSADQLRKYKIDAKYNIKHNIATKCENNVLKTGRSLDVSFCHSYWQKVFVCKYRNPNNKRLRILTRRMATANKTCVSGKN